MRRRPGCSLQPRWLAGRGKVQPPGSWSAARFTPPARSVTGWPKAIVASAGPLAMAGAASTTKKVKMRSPQWHPLYAIIIQAVTATK
jgi:hypothetical protein